MTSSPPRHVTPSHYGRPRAPPPLVYQMHSPHSGDSSHHRGFPGGFSPIRPTTMHLYSPRESHPSESDSLYASFSPPRPVETRSRATPHAIQPSRSDQSYSPVVDRSIFRPKQNCVIVARGPSHDASSVTYVSKGSSPRPAPFASSRETPTPASRNATASFPMKLHEILSSPEYKDCITWLPHGRAWRVLKPKIFEEEVLPKFFRSR
jgi:hypothetical protein